MRREVYRIKVVPVKHKKANKWQVGKRPRHHFELVCKLVAVKCGNADAGSEMSGC